MNIYKVIDQARDAYFVRAVDAEAAQAAFEAWRDLPSVENPAGRAILSVDLIASDDPTLLGRQNYVEAP
jgi:hypothetical protein